MLPVLFLISSCLLLLHASLAAASDEGDGSSSSDLADDAMMKRQDCYWASLPLHCRTSPIYKVVGNLVLIWSDPHTVHNQCIYHPYYIIYGWYLYLAVCLFNSNFCLHQRQMFKSRPGWLVCSKVVIRIEWDWEVMWKCHSIDLQGYTRILRGGPSSFTRISRGGNGPTSFSRILRGGPASFTRYDAVARPILAWVLPKIMGFVFPQVLSQIELRVQYLLWTLSP